MKRIVLLVPALPVLSLALAACAAEDPPPSAVCPTPAGAGVVHSGDVTEDETWRAEDGPHRVEGSVVVRDGATLTIEPCVEVEFGPDAALDVGASDSGEVARLVARGEPERPIRLSRSADAPWSSLAIFAPSTADLANLELEGAGSDPFREHAALLVVGSGVAPNEGHLHADAVTVRSSAGVGVLLQRAATFEEGSRELVVEESASFPLVVGQHSLGSLPSGDLVGNAVDEVLVREDLANGFVGLQHDTTMRKLSVPYRIGTENGEPLRVGSSSLEGFATLTIEPGVELRFRPGVMLRVLASPEAALGAIRALGEPGSPVVFTSASATPSPGDWAGLYFEAPVASENDLRHTVVEYAGGYCSCALSSCSPVSFSEAAIVVDGGAPPAAFLRDSTIRHSAGHGVVRSWLDHPEVDFLASNTFDGVAGCAQTAPVLTDVVCPSVDYRCD
jgi:hypothetical protein